jgi:hypothetical protein
MLCKIKREQGESHYLSLSLRSWSSFTLKTVTAMFAETLENYQHSAQPNPESRSHYVESTLQEVGCFFRPFRIMLCGMLCSTSTIFFRVL